MGLVLGEGFDEPRVREVEDLPVRLVHRRRLQAQGGGHRELGGGARARLLQTEKISAANRSIGSTTGFHNPL